ncbi:MAG: DUF354 domain-containing protein [Methanotrichaceae archaeon]|nr:DUF354 domain-containing protein [Methanotrichaceae archaeon]
MKIIVEMGHPAHVHQFKNMIWKLTKDGHDVRICATNKDVELELLNIYGFDYLVLGDNHSARLRDKLILLVNSEYRMMDFCRRFKPDLFISRMGLASAHISRILRRPHISFTDDDKRILSDLFVTSSTDYICTPEYFRISFGGRHIRFKGYKELAYLHPNYFQPDLSILDELALDESDRFILLRFVAWTAVHDYGMHGIGNKLDLIRELEDQARILITSESKLARPLEKYRINAPPDVIHDLLYYACMIVGDSQTMTTEAAVLGTPAIRCNSFVGGGDIGNFIELEKKYKLIFNYSDPIQAMHKALQILETPNIKEEWQKRRAKLLRDKIDVTSFMVWLVEGYPDSCKQMIEDPDIQLQFQST